MSDGTTALHDDGRGDGDAPSQPYSQRLDAIGFFVERAGGRDILVHEITGGFLVVFRTLAGQQVVTLEPSDVADLYAEALEQDEPHAWGWLRAMVGGADDAPDAGRSPDAPAIPRGPRGRLRAAGRYLDARHASAIMVQEHADGYEMEFTGLPANDNLALLSRLNERFDNPQLAAWSPAR